MMQILKLSDKEMNIIVINTFKKIGDKPEDFSQKPGLKKKEKEAKGNCRSEKHNN